MELTIKVPSDFSFKRTVVSHGWYGLLPFEFDRETWTLSRVVDLNGSRPVTLKITSAGRELRIQPSRRLNQAAAREVVAHVRHILRLDEEMADFYGRMSAEEEFNWIPIQGAGRLLRSPTVFEDLVKMICTTNCSWALTQKMVTGLVKNLGREASDGRRTFPSAEAMALVPESFYTDEVRAGYRSSYLKELADRVAAGELDVEGWLRSPLSTADLIKEMRRVKGVGPYAAENVLKLIGRYDGLALDSWTRAKFYEVRNNGQKATDKKIDRFYARFKEWRGLALWCDMTRDWLE